MIYDDIDYVRMIYDNIDDVRMHRTKCTNIIITDVLCAHYEKELSDHIDYVRMIYDI